MFREGRWWGERKEWVGVVGGKLRWGREVVLGYRGYEGGKGWVEKGVGLENVLSWMG